MVGSRRHAPGDQSFRASVSLVRDVLVHGQDTAIPLGRPHTVPLDPQPPPQPGSPQCGGRCPRCSQPARNCAD